jgi:hypothetical protein
VNGYPIGTRILAFSYVVTGVTREASAAGSCGNRAIGGSGILAR